MKRRLFAVLTVFCLLCAVTLTGCEEQAPSIAATTTTTTPSSPNHTQTPSDAPTATLDTLPPFSGGAFVVLNDNIPLFSEKELTTDAYELYSPHDALGRCGTAIACIGQELMPTEERGSIGSVKPSGWHTVKYDIIDGKYLYNRCHLIGFQLTGENANEQNLITGTRFLNVDGMLPFENMVADYIRETNNHVMYRITPLYKGNDLLAHGVTMEAYSVEDNGEGICFYVYCYNAQPGIDIVYVDGSSSLAAVTTTVTTAASTSALITTTASPAAELTYVLNTGSMKIHVPDCSAVGKISEHNYAESALSLDELIAQGYDPCGICMD